MNELNSLTVSDDWESFYNGRALSEDFPIKAVVMNIMNKYANWSTKPGKIFELGCGASRILTKSGFLSWEISGIDFNETSNTILKKFAKVNAFKVGQIIDADVLNYDCTKLENIFDIIFSASFLCHFKKPSEILSKWSSVLKPGGKVISFIPNLSTVNGNLMKKYDLELWKKHNVFLPAHIDQMHVDAGLKIVEKAKYDGKYYVDFYIPWDKIKAQISSRIVYKMFRYFAFFIEKFVRTFSFINKRQSSPFIIGVYEKV